jgi:phage shock protein C
MQSRLMRSRTEIMIAGVCGGLAEYFGLDPVIVRLIFVLVTLTTGIGFIVYPVLWIVMPKAGSTSNPPPLFTQDADAWRQRVNEFGQEVAQAGQQISQEVRQVFLRESGQPTQAPTVADEPPPAAYNFDPLTGQPVNRAAPTTGQTINLRVDPTVAGTYVPPAENTLSNAAPQQPVYYGPPAQAPRKNRGRSMGIVLVAFGVMILAGTLGIAEYVFPVLMIGAGILLLRKR